MPSTQNSSSSLDSFRSRSEQNHMKSKIESYLLSPPCTIALEEHFAEDDISLSLMTIFRCAESLSYTMFTTSEEEKRRIIYNQTMIKKLTIDCLEKRGIEHAITLPHFPKDDGYVLTPAVTETPESIPRALITSPPPPTLYYEASDEETPRPIPQPQLAIRSSGRPRRNRNRGTLAFAVGLSRPSPPTPVFKEDTTPSLTPAPASPIPLPSTSTARAQSEETWADRCGRDISTITCRYCKAEGHRQINCPRYFCRVCNNHAPRHLSARCPDLGKTKIVTAAPGTDAFHAELKAWEDKQDAITAAKEDEWYRNEFHGDQHGDPDVYFNEDS
jgi:hypothetical protein